MFSKALRVAVAVLVGSMIGGCGEADLVTTETPLHNDYRLVPEQFQMTQALGSSGRAVLFLNFEGQTIKYGGSSSKQNTSWIVPQNKAVAIPPFNTATYGGVNREAAIAQLVEMVKQDFKAYDVVVTTQRPTSGDYTMVMVGGTPNLINEAPGTAGIAPLDVGNPNRNDVVFVFSGTLYNLRELATCISHEVGHSFGLEHLEPTDAIMYPVLQQGTLAWKNARIYGKSSYQNQPGILNALFGAPTGGSTPPPSQPAPSTPSTPTAQDSAVFVSQELPPSVMPGEEFIAKVTFKNTGNTTWSGTEGFALSASNTTWGGDTLVLPYSVAPGATRTIAFYARAPQTPGSYAFQWFLTHDGVAFGAKSQLVTITVTGSTNQLPKGELTYADGEWGYGVAYDPDIPNEAIWVDIHVDGQYAGSILADRSQDGSSHGFAFGMPALGGGTHKIAAYAVDHEGKYAYKLPGDFYVSQ